jgi:hypothetical protein
MSDSSAPAHAAYAREIEGAFLFCSPCAAVHRVTRSDRAPTYLADGTPLATDDRQEFLAAHRDHDLRLLRRSGDAEMISHPRWDPMCRVAWEVSDGRNDFVVTFGRLDVETPRQYSILPGRLVLESESVEVDTEVLHAVIDEALYPHVAPLRKIGALIDECERLVSVIPLQNLEPLAELREDPNVQLACLPDSVAGALCVAVVRAFPKPEADLLIDVIDGDLRREIPILRVTRHYRIEGRWGVEADEG